MALHEPSPPFQPLFQAPSKLARIPLHAWQSAVYCSIVSDLRRPEPALGSLEARLNLLSLFEAYRGSNERAARICDAQIRFWRDLSRQPGGGHHLAKVLQPWLNLARLGRWQGDLDKASALYREFSPAHRSSPGQMASRYGIEQSLTEVGAHDASSGFNFSAFFDAVYWPEYADLLFRANRTEELRAHLSAGVAGNFNRLALFEYVLAGMARRERFDEALRLLARVMPPKSKPHWLQWQTTALRLHAGRDRFATVPGGLADEVFEAAMLGRHGKADVHELSLLLEIARVFRQLGLLPQERALTERAVALATVVNDEVLQFEAASRLAAHLPQPGIDLRAQFRDTGYALIRKRLGLPALDESAMPDVAAAIELLAQHDYAGCADLLESPCAALA